MQRDDKVPSWFEKFFEWLKGTHRRLSKKFGARSAIILMVLPVLLAFTVPPVVVSLIPGSEASCQVTGKDRAGARQADMRVYTENCGTFTVADNLLLLRFNSADVYGSIAVGESYDFDTTGVRFAPLSMFPNIVGVTPAE